MAAGLKVQDGFAGSARNLLGTCLGQFHLFASAHKHAHKHVPACSGLAVSFESLPAGLLFGDNEAHLSHWPAALRA